ncbi:MAG: fused MFS/spermidine synthase, partial [Akkermansiaceae bacterium]
RVYALLEWGIAGSAILYFGLLLCFESFYPALYRMLVGSEWMLVAKLLLAILLIFPAAFFMGGTVPVIGQVMIRDCQRFGRTAAWLYGLNTLGAALGVWAAAFVLMPNLGFKVSYLFTVLLSLAVGIVAWKLAKQEVPAEVEQVATEKNNTDESHAEWWSRGALVGLCFFSGFVILALEVVWTRVFAQVHENSVYAFAIILIVVLICLAIGAGISSLVARFVKRPMLALAVMATVGGCLLVFGPSLLMHVTKDLEPFHTNEPWAEHVQRSFKMTVGGIGYIVIALGTVFPFLMKVAERGLKMPGRMLGRLLAINTAGAIVGSLLCGFVFLPNMGMWGTLKVLTAAYLLIALLVPSGWGKAAVTCRVAGLGALILLFTVLDPSGLPVMGTVKGKELGKVLEVWEESDCTVAVIEKKNGHRVIVVNAGYSLGSTAAYVEQANQARIPLYLFPETESICFIGMGTGMSAGAALDFRFPKVKRVVTCELSPAVVEASKKWIPKHFLGGLFDDERSTILTEDGRHYLMATSESYDMINADLFLPYRRGTGSLYSADHYRVVAKRLNPGGVFVQWLPLYQLTEHEFGVIARTMTEVFGEVTMWRNNFHPGQEKVALIGRLECSPFPVSMIRDPEAMKSVVDGWEWSSVTPDQVMAEAESMPFFYAGNLTEASSLFENYSVNTDDMPVIEYQTPKMFRDVAEQDQVIWCVGPKLTGWIDRIFELCPLEDDPVWRGHPESSVCLAKSGAAFHRLMVAKALRKWDDAEKNWEVFLRKWKKVGGR